jgi:GNAT superfamily N-acetyltransferase
MPLYVRHPAQRCHVTQNPSRRASWRHSAGERSYRDLPRLVAVSEAYPAESVRRGRSLSAPGNARSDAWFATKARRSRDGGDGVVATVSVVSGPVSVRDGRHADAPALLAMLDGAIRWMVARGQAIQWGTQPASEHAGWCEHVGGWVTGPGLLIAEIDGQTVGASVIVDAAPPHVPATARRETYLLFLISDRAHRGEAVGSDLVRRAAADARAAGSEILRVDCWAGAADLVAWYERQNFARSAAFTVDLRGGWDGQVFEMTL